MAFAPFDLTGKVALVTGGCSGIGLAMAEALAQAGADVVLWDINEGAFDAALSRVGAAGTRVGAYKVDVSSEEEVTAGILAIVEDYGRLDSAFANAGMGEGVPFLELTGKNLKRTMDVNLGGVLWVFREAARHMVDRAANGDPGGSLIATSSIAAIDATPRNESYGAAKAAVANVVKAVAVEFARYGVRANAIMPGWTRTGLSEGSANFDQLFDKVIKPRVPARRWGVPEDFAGIAVYLASDASNFHTGQHFVLDGGYTIF